MYKVYMIETIDNRAIRSYKKIIIVHMYLRFITLDAVIISQSTNKVEDVGQRTFSELGWSGRVYQTPADLRNLVRLELIVIHVLFLLI